MCGSSDVVTRAATVFAGSVTTLAGDATCVAGSVSWAATTLAGTVVVLAAQWQGLLQCLQDLFQMQRWLQGMLHKSHLEFLVPARLQALFQYWMRLIQH